MADVIHWSEYLGADDKRYLETHKVLSRHILAGIEELDETPLHEIAVELCRQVGCAVTTIWPPEEWEAQAAFFGEVVTAVIVAAKEDYDERQDKG